MPSYLLILEYNGSRFSGWQKQPGGVITVQGEIEKALKRFFGKPVKITGTGRTDSGVHALAQAASFEVERETGPERILAGLNALLPKDISVKSVRKVKNGFNARYRCTGKQYEYRIWNRPVRSVWEAGTSLHVKKPLKINAIEKALKYICGRHDFSAFASSGGGQKNKIIRIRRATVSKRSGFIYITLEAPRFLYHMVRNIVGTLIETGRGRLKPEGMAQIIASKDRSLGCRTAPARGLFLKKVQFK